MNLQFRDLNADEIELRVGQVVMNERTKGFTLLLYKNARIDMQLLDEVVGVGNWQREHRQIGNDIYCRVGIWNTELQQWVWREDAGSAGTIEEEKSKASDSFKRACVNFGLGRCLYSAPFVWINLDDNNTTKSRYFVKEISYKDHKISKLVICNEKTNEVVYSYPKGTNTSQNGNKPQNNPKSTQGSGKGTIRPTEKEKIAKLIATFDQDKLNKFLNWLNTRYHTVDFNELSDEEGIMVCVSWKL